MKPIDCELEADVLAAVLQNRWPDRVDPGLRIHAAACQICSDVVTIAGAIDSAHAESRAQAVIPDSGRVWWLAQMRARREDAQRAGSPITAAQVIAFACAMGLLGACFGATSAWFQAALRRIASSLSEVGFQTLLPSAGTFVAQHGLLLAAIGILLLGVPAAIYLTLLKE